MRINYFIKDEETKSPHSYFTMFHRTLFCVVLLVLSNQLKSQSLTGIWRGSFGVRSGATNSVANIDRYNFEVQVWEKSNGELMGVTYSYKKKEFFGKARFSGRVSADRKRVTIKELAITDVSKNEKADVCAMICNLLISKNSNGTEKMSGSFTSNNLSTKTKCYDGDVILLRVSQSNFPVESFLRNKMNNQPRRDVKAAQSDDTVVIDRSNRKKYLLEIPDNNDWKQPKTLDIEKVSPAELGGRDNHLTASITQPNKEVSVMIYDNGIIDNDTISIYIDSEKRYSGVRLTEKPLTFVLTFSDLKTSYELITFAENLGELAPNTGLLVIKSGNKMIEIPIMSNFKRNAKIKISYRANCKVAIERYD
jgi:hypothetical protein